MPRTPFPDTTVPLLLPFPLAASFVEFPNAASSACRREPASAANDKGRWFTLRIAHQQVATVAHDRYEDGVGYWHIGSDTVPDTRRRFLALALVHTVTVTKPVRVRACPVISMLHACNPARVLVIASLDGTQDRGEPIWRSAVRGIGACQ